MCGIDFQYTILLIYIPIYPQMIIDMAHIVDMVRNPKNVLCVIPLSMTFGWK
jgi:hypothetical protein